MIKTRNNLRAARAGFTLVEILVVLAIAALLSAFIFGGFASLGASNKRVSCQTNMQQIYQACRAYANDEGGAFPYYNATSPVPTPYAAPNGAATGARGIGLWLLFTFPKSASTHVASDSDFIADVGSAPLERYIRNSQVLHCPRDSDNDNLYLDSQQTYLNPNYLSYQNLEPANLSNGSSNPSAGTPTYQAVRTTDDGAASGNAAQQKLWQRQLLHFNAGTVAAPTQSSLVVRAADSSTVVTWCRFHRDGMGGRDYDNVLFYDGTVQYIPRVQPNPDPTGPPTLTDFQRVPKTG